MIEILSLLPLDALPAYITAFLFIIVALGIWHIKNKEVDVGSEGELRKDLMKSVQDCTEREMECYKRTNQLAIQIDNLHKENFALREEITNLKSELLKVKGEIL